jgi:beta-glucosidase
MLYTSAAKTVHGLNAEYFDNVKLEGEPVLRRKDASVNFSWGFNGVSRQLSKNYSVRWTGVLAPTETGDFILGFTGQDGYRVWVDGQLQVEDWTPHRPSTTQTKAIHLEKGKTYALKIEYFQTVRAAEARLVWGQPGYEEQEAVAAAKNADLVVTVLGLSARIEGEEMKVKADGFAGGDRTSLDLPRPQRELLEAVQAAGKPMVLVLTNGSAVAVNWADEHVPAILEAWYPGESGGKAVAEALAGDFSPAGRLPVTFYKSVEQLPAFENYAMVGRTYRYFAGEALYPFGYGLGYSEFKYSNARVDHASFTGDGAETLSVDVTNAGAMAADEVVEIYLSHQGIAGAPLRELKGFRRVHLARGEKKTVSFALSDRDVSVVDSEGTRRLVPGDVRVWIGGGPQGVRQGLVKASGVEAEFKVAVGKVLPE